MNRYFGIYIFWIVISGMICLVSACNNDAVSEKQSESFLKYYAAGSFDNTGTEVIQTSDGYAIMGNFDVSTGIDIFIIFTDKFGRQKTGEPYIIGTDLNDHGHSMIRLTDGTYLISGSSFNAAQKMGYLVNVSSDGTVLWEQNYSEGYNELEFRSAYLASDGNIIITGYSKRTAEDKDTEAIIGKTSVTGDLRWLRTIGLEDRNDVGEAIIEAPNRYHILTTSTDVSNMLLSYIRMYNTNTDGRGETNCTIETPFISGKDMVQNTAGNLYILGNHRYPSSTWSKIFLAELDFMADGVITHLKDSAIIPYDVSLHAESFALTDQNELAIGGWQTKTNDNDILFMKVVVVGADIKLLKLNTYGTPKGSQTSENIIYTADDEGFALTGSVDLAGGRTSMLLKIDSEGELR
jgi:hypothetical protein